MSLQTCLHARIPVMPGINDKNRPEGRFFEESSGGLYPSTEDLERFAVVTTLPPLVHLIHETST